MADSYLFVFSNPTEGNDDEFNSWYETRHVPDVLDVEGVTAAQRYELAPITPPEAEGIAAPPAPAHRYLAVYELDRDPDIVMGSFLERVGSGEMALSDSLDLAGVSMAVWRPRGERTVAGEVR
jgi:hypothetical protein